MAATLQATFGPRFVLGLGRGNPGWLAGAGLHMAGYRELADYVDILRRLWRGERVAYSGPARRVPPPAARGRGRPPAAAGVVRHPGPARWAPRPPRPASTACCSRPSSPPRRRVRSSPGCATECERLDRDPASLRICQSVITAPDLDDLETRALAHARAVTYLDAPGYGEMLVELNGWDPAPLAKLRDHEQFKDLPHDGQRPELPPHRAARPGVARPRRVDGAVLRPRVGRADACRRCSASATPAPTRS